MEKRLNKMEEKIDQFMERKKKEEEKSLQEEYISMLPLNQENLETFEKKLRKIEFRNIIVRKILKFLLLTNFQLITIIIYLEKVHDRY